MNDDLHTNVKGIRPDLPAPAWETREQAIRIIRDTAVKIDTDRTSKQLPALADAPMSRQERANAIRFILSGDQDAASVAAAGAQVIAFLESILRAEDASPYTGDAA